MSERHLLTGWGRTPATVARVDRPTTVRGLAELAGSRPTGGLIARGCGRSYGDQALNAGGSVVDCTGTAGIVSVDLDDGVVVATGGTSLDQLMRELVPSGWFVPVTPGTRFVTVGGAIANDIHGKNHHAAGSFGNFVRSLTLLLPSGEQRTIGPDSDSALFWATVGGMGLTGVILDATIRMSRIETSRLVVDTERTADLDECMALMTEGDDSYGCSAAWIDCLAKGTSLGRSVLYRGDFARPDQLTARGRVDPLRFRPRRGARVPDHVPPGLLNRFTAAAFNEAWYRRAPQERRGEIQDITTFFHPLDAVTSWNRLYGPGGFVQQQFVLPFGAEETLRRIVERFADSRCASFLAVLKRFGPGNPGLLSFPMPGWTLALDVPASAARLGEVLDGVDDLIVEAGGRVYLAKDARTRPELLADMYPGLDRFREVRASVDPDHVLRSDLARRLGL